MMITKEDDELTMEDLRRARFYVHMHTATSLLGRELAARRDREVIEEMERINNDRV